MATTDSVICSVTNGVFTAGSVCAHLLRIRKYFHKKHTNLGSVFLYGTSRLSLKEGESV